MSNKFVLKFVIFRQSAYPSSIVTQEAALNILKTGANVFLTGEPGSGKTHTVNEYIRYLREHDINPSITASTGIAATHVGGMTIHSWSGIGIKKELSERDLDELESRESLVKRLSSAKVLIIDEISMLDGKLLGLVDLVCRTLRHNEDAFGGLQLVLVGDFFQLPPIARLGEAPAQFCFDSRVWERLTPIVCYLSEQHRQEDFTFLATLGAIRRGEVEESVYECLEERRTPPDEHPEGVPRLYTHNKDVDSENTSALGKIATESETFYMTTQGKPGAIETLKRGCLSPEVLELKEGASVMFTKNSFDAGYVNGTLGTITGFDVDTLYPIVTTREGGVITATPAEWALEDGGKTLAKIIQIPLRLAWAITVHKSQGMSMDAAIIDLSRAFEYGQGYVALSRVRTLAGIHLLGVNQRALEVHPLVLARDQSFRQSSGEAEEGFEALEGEELAKLHENFLTAMGGSITKKSFIKKEFGVPKISTYDETLALVVSNKTLKEIVEARQMTESTIVKHLEELALMGKLPSLEIATFAGFERAQFDEIREAILANVGDFLKPIFEHLKEKYSYEQIRLVRLEQGPPPRHKLNNQHAKSVTGSSVSEKPTKLGAKWNKEEEMELTKLFNAGVSTREIAKKLERLPGGIRARLKKLELLDK